MEKPLSCQVKLKIKGSDVFFSTGMAELLLLVKELKSLRMAANKMGMAYSKAWRIIKIAEDELGFSLLVSTKGGTHGGGSVLTEECIEFLEKYTNMKCELDDVSQELFNKYF